jgi:Xaa-Pro aminopeptidase
MTINLEHADDHQYKKRRDELLNNLEDTLVIIPAAGLKTRSYDTSYKFRQDSNYKYYTGINEQDGYLVLSYDVSGNRKSMIFVLDKNPEMEQWDGIRLGYEKAKDYSEVDEGHPLSEFENVLKNSLVGHKKIAFDLANKELMDLVTSMLRPHWFKRRGQIIPNEFLHLPVYTGKQRLVKSQVEILTMKRAAKLTERAHLAAMAKTSPGVNESEVYNIINFIFNQENASGQAYESIVAGGVNANILHYIENNQQLNDGDLLLIDAGCEFNGYASDVTRTFPVNGKFSEPQKQVYQAVLDAQKNAIAQASPGNTLKDVHMAACRVLADFLIKNNILSGSVDDVIENGSLKKYYPHGTGHWIGLDVHDTCPYDIDGEEIVFSPGMVFTVEPGLYFPENDSTPNPFQGIGVRIEDDILITKKGHENLTVSIPKEIKEVEQVCQNDFSALLFPSS